MAFKRVLIVGCSHGVHICPRARNAVLKFKKDFKPQTVVHLGDFCDTAALRSGAKGTRDEGEDIEPDIDGGLGFLREIGANIVLAGNHEHRIWQQAESPNAVVAYAAGQILGAIQDFCKASKVQFHEYSGIHQVAKLGDYTLTHGSIYNENSVRDNAEIYGNVVHAHTHRPGIAYGRRIDSPIGFCVGTLTPRRAMGYAQNRRATLSWGMGFVWGEYDDKKAHLQLCLGPQEQNPDSEWRLP